MIICNCCIQIFEKNLTRGAFPMVDLRNFNIILNIRGKFTSLNSLIQFFSKKFYVSALGFLKLAKIY